MFTVLAMTAMRAGEMLGLQWGDIYLDNRWPFAFAAAAIARGERPPVQSFARSRAAKVAAAITTACLRFSLRCSSINFLRRPSIAPDYEQVLNELNSCAKESRERNKEAESAIYDDFVGFHEQGD
jgi:hypothetical protein